MPGGWRGSQQLSIGLAFFSHALSLAEQAAATAPLCRMPGSSVDFPSTGGETTQVQQTALAMP
jgi:hypothetical protein